MNPLNSKGTTQGYQRFPYESWEFGTMTQVKLLGWFVFFARIAKSSIKGVNETYCQNKSLSEWPNRWKKTADFQLGHICLKEVKEFSYVETDSLGEIRDF